MAKKEKSVHCSGKRKRAVARATLVPGTGKVKFNNTLLENIKPDLLRLKLTEPLIIADKYRDKINIDVKVNGGGASSQIEAARLAVARAIIEFTKDNKLKQSMLEYDRHLLVADVRRKETCKPNDSKARAKRQKSYR